MRFTVRRVRLPLLHPFATSFGTETARDALVLELASDGADAFSECAASENPYYTYEDNDTALHVIRDMLAREVKEGMIPSPEDFALRAERIRGHNMAKAAVEMLLWDFRAKTEGKTLAEALGEPRGYADVGIALGMDRPEATVARVASAVRRGYRRVKVKIDRGKELEILSAVRDAFPEISLSADANGCFSLADLDGLKKLDRFDLAYLEQPLGYDDILDHAKLAREIGTPICLDESVSSPDAARQALEVGAASVINVKPGRVGGLTNALKIARIAREAGAHVWVGGMLETGVGRAFIIALASQASVDYPGDTSPNDNYFERDIVSNPFTMRDGRITPNHGPGIGIELDRAMMEQATTAVWNLTESGQQ